MTAYYNENDPSAAAWLRELIKVGAIAAGEVDTRSIEDVTPSELSGYTQHHFFAGIGGWSYALRLADWPDNRPVWTGSCPCQPFSAAGKGGGFADERHLWPAWLHLIRAYRPQCVFGEQVANALAWLDLVSDDMENENYAVRAAIVGAHSVGAPHIRQRLYWVADSTLDGSGAFDGQPGASLRPQEPVRRRGISNGLADRDGERLAQRSQSYGGTDGPEQPTSRRANVGGRYKASDLEHSESNGRLERRPESSGRSATSRRRSSLMGNASSTGSRRDTRAVSSSQSGVERSVRSELNEPEGSGSVGDAELSNGTRQRPLRISLESKQEAERSRDANPWASTEFIGCADGKARPAQPGIFPLAYGVPGRVGLLRGYGNAIVPQVAAEFIKATELV